MSDSVSSTSTENTSNKVEEFLVLLEFTDSNEAKYSQENSNKFKVLEIENRNPIIQIGNRLYSGEYQNNIGTYLFFQQNLVTNKNSEEEIGITTSSSSYSGKTYKKLVLNRLYIKPKEKNFEEGKNKI